MLTLLSLLVPLPVLSDSSSLDTPPDTPPSVVFILADDLGYGDVGCFGQTKIRTPNIDALAARGMRLTRHYAGNAVCAPSRCVLMTGQHPGRAEIRSNREIQPEGQWPLEPSTITLAERFAAHGYTCGGFGKWGLGGPGTVGAPLECGFDRWYGYNGQRQAHNFYPTYLWDDDEVAPLRNRAYSGHARLPADAEASDPSVYERYLGPDYSADLIAGQAVAFVRRTDGPLFLFHPSTIPHLGLQVPLDASDEYEFENDDPYPGGRGYSPVFRPRATYAAMVTRLDTHVGQIVDALQQTGRLDSTYIVFTSDNGPAYDRLGGTDSEFFESAGGLRGRKGELFEGGVRVPTIVAGPGIAPGTESDRRSGFEDWTPTLLELAGGADWSTGLSAKDDAEIPIDGVSLAPTLRGTEQSPRPPLYREFSGYGGQQAVWDGRWKAIRTGLAKRATEWQLYDLDADPLERSDVAADHPEVVAKLAGLAAAMREPSPVFPIRGLDAE